MQALVRDLNRAYRETPALWEVDFDGAGFSWLEPNDAAANVFAFARFGAGATPPLVCLLNLSPVPREAYRVGLPRGGTWHEILNTDATRYSGTGIGNSGAVEAEPTPWNNQPFSATVTLPPLAGVWLRAAS